MLNESLDEPCFHRHEFPRAVPPRHPDADKRTIGRRGTIGPAVTITYPIPSGRRSPPRPELFWAYGLRAAEGSPRTFHAYWYADSNDKSRPLPVDRWAKRKQT